MTYQTKYNTKLFVANQTYHKRFIRLIPPLYIYISQIVSHTNSTYKMMRG